jgi:hypothetical protein
MRGPTADSEIWPCWWIHVVVLFDACVVAVVPAGSVALGASAALTRAITIGALVVAFGAFGRTWFVRAEMSDDEVVVHNVWTKTVVHRADVVSLDSRPMRGSGPRIVVIELRQPRRFRRRLGIEATFTTKVDDHDDFMRRVARAIGPD